MAKPLSEEDIVHTVTYARESLQTLSNARVFLTGGTGFFGHWLLESLLHANHEFGLNAQATVLTRSPARFQHKAPHLAADPAIHLHAGDIRSFGFPAETFTHIIHAAADAVTPGDARSSYDLAESIVDGTRRVLQLAQASGARRLLYISSGAVYGRSSTAPFTAETYTGSPDPLSLQSSYDEAKRMAEHFCVAYAHETPLQPVIARCFTFVGPHLPLDRHFAIGNFIGDAIAGHAIEIRGDGTPRRSWLYMADLAAWLWTLLVRGQSGRAYNVGSDEDHTIAAAAWLVARTLRPDGNGGSTLPVHIHGIADTSAAINQYVPSVERVFQELGLKARIPLEEAVRRTALWYGFPALGGQL
jgi:dTDP-glucose 4,6-dehydratase